MGSMGMLLQARSKHRAVAESSHESFSFFHTALVSQRSHRSPKSAVSISIFKFLLVFYHSRYQAPSYNEDIHH